MFSRGSIVLKRSWVKYQNRLRTIENGCGGFIGRDNLLSLVLDICVMHCHNSSKLVGHDEEVDTDGPVIELSLPAKRLNRMIELANRCLLIRSGFVWQLEMISYLAVWKLKTLQIGSDEVVKLKTSLTWFGISPRSVGKWTQFRHILFTRSSLNTTISWVQYWILKKFWDITLNCNNKLNCEPLR